MGMPLNGFNPSQHPDPDQRMTVPSGKYLAMITASEEKINSKGTGYYLELRLKIVDGEFKDTPLWARLNLKNPNETAVKIAQSELAMICRATGVDEPRDSSDFHDLPILIDVKKVARKDIPGEHSNEIKAYYNKLSGAAQAPNPAQATPAVGQPATSPGVERAPWEK